MSWYLTILAVLWYFIVKGHAHWISVYFIPKVEINLIFRGILLLYNNTQSSKMSLTIPKILISPHVALAFMAQNTACDSNDPN